MGEIELTSLLKRCEPVGDYKPPPLVIMCFGGNVLVEMLVVGSLRW